MLVRKVVKSVVVAGAILLMFGSCAFAGTTLERYSTTVGRFNGSGFTEYQTKTFTGEEGYLYSNAVGGNYVVDVRMVTSKKEKGPWVRDVDDNRSYCLPGKTLRSGRNVRLELSNDITTPVRVQVAGKWKSN